MSKVGVGAHITAAAPGGPRFDPSISSDQRRSAANGLWLCNSCGRLVDNDDVTYTVAVLVGWKRDAIDRAQEALASGGRSTTEGLFAAHLEVQQQALAEQREARGAQATAQRLALFRDQYTRFLDAARRYAQAIQDYLRWLFVTNYRMDRPTRAAQQRPIKEAREALQAALQPILLSDDDDARGILRWELIRLRNFEPTVDTTQNQETYAQVIHYNHLRLLQGINALQTNVCAELGLSTRTPNDEAKQFEEQMLASSKANADAANASIQVQFANLAAGRTRPGSTPGSADELRTRLWNVLHAAIFEDDDDPRDRGRLTMLFLREIWREVLVRPMDELGSNLEVAWRAFRDVFMTCDEKHLYAIVSHAGRSAGIRTMLAEALERARAPYHFVGGTLRARSGDESPRS